MIQRMPNPLTFWTSFIFSQENIGQFALGWVDPLEELNIFKDSCVRTTLVKVGSNQRQKIYD